MTLEPGGIEDSPSKLPGGGLGTRMLLAGGILFSAAAMITLVANSRVHYWIPAVMLALGFVSLIAFKVRMSRVRLPTPPTPRERRWRWFSFARIGSIALILLGAALSIQALGRMGLIGLLGFTVLQQALDIREARGVRDRLLATLPLAVFTLLVVAAILDIGWLFWAFLAAIGILSVVGLVWFVVRGPRSRTPLPLSDPPD